MARIDKIDRRTDVVFILFHYADEIEGVTKLQKLLFLIEKETEFFTEYESEVAFEFAPYKMGPFSKHVYEELEFLLSLDAIEGEELSESNHTLDTPDLTEKRFTLTKKGEKIATEVVSQLETEYRNELDQVVREYNSLPLQELIEYVYDQYPSYAAESEIIDEMNVELSQPHQD